MFTIYWSIILVIILLILLLICCLLRINEQIEQENANLKKKLDIVHNELDSILERYASAERKPPPES